MTHHFLDWLSARVPCFHPVPIDGGRIMKVSPEGEVVWETAVRLEVEGSHESNLLIRTCGVYPNAQGGMNGIVLEVSGNPTKWLQGHNVFGGFAEPCGLLELTMYRLYELLPELLQPTDLDLVRWREGHFDITRVDVCAMYQLDSRASVRAVLWAMEQRAYLRHRGRGTLTKNGTLYFGQNSRRWALKLYAKGDELEAGKGHGLPPDLLSCEQVQAFASDKLRIELVMRSLELKRRDLSHGLDWGMTTSADLLNAIVQGIEMSEVIALPMKEVAELPHRLRLVYLSWQKGEDLRAILPKSTFYYCRNELLKKGIDIAVRQSYEDRSNVVPFVRIIECVPCGPPEWAYGTSLLAGPSDLVEARQRFQERRKAV